LEQLVVEHQPIQIKKIWHLMQHVPGSNSIQKMAPIQTPASTNGCTTL
jgi:hypothetical protein